MSEELDPATDVILSIITDARVTVDVRLDHAKYSLFKQLYLAAGAEDVILLDLEGDLNGGIVKSHIVGWKVRLAVQVAD